jgi:hypothetical protein
MKQLGPYYNSQVKEYHYDVHSEYPYMPSPVCSKLSKNGR